MAEGESLGASPKGITGQGESTLLLLGLTQRRGFGPRKEVHESRLGLQGGPRWPFHQSGWGLRHIGGRGPGTQRKKGKRYPLDLPSDCWADLDVPHYCPTIWAAASSKERGGEDRTGSGSTSGSASTIMVEGAAKYIGEPGPEWRGLVSGVVGQRVGESKGVCAPNWWG